MKSHRSPKRYVVCINNAGYPASLELRKIYRCLTDSTAARHGLLRVIDESGEDYLYPDSFFVVIELPRTTERLLSRPVSHAARRRTGLRTRLSKAR